MTSILMFGRDIRLLETRAWVLETAGYKVRTVSSVEALDQVLASESIDLLVLCHSLSTEQCNQTLILTKDLPKVKILLLTTGERGCNSQIQEAIFDITNGPAPFLSTVGKLVCPTCASRIPAY
jgi:DNA-binding NtrC family response regulator